ncbi:hypothetical protein B0H21DRAFT_368512 [Amylocystis lapponica]|nr:hypothetical protein B0H21DRAFT_368512 [Amylocystis lapponica]
MTLAIDHRPWASTLRYRAASSVCMRRFLDYELRLCGHCNDTRLSRRCTPHPRIEATPHRDFGHGRPTLYGWKATRTSRSTSTLRSAAASSTWRHGRPTFDGWPLDAPRIGSRPQDAPSGHGHARCCGFSRKMPAGHDIKTQRRTKTRRTSSRGRRQLIEREKEAADAHQNKNNLSHAHRTALYCQSGTINALSSSARASR